MNELSSIFKNITEFGAMCGLVAFLYRFFTTEKSRITHHRKLRVWAYITYKTSWIGQAKKASDYVRRFLNWVYGKPDSCGRLLSTCYFNQRAWKASFTIALFYLMSFIIILYYSSKKGGDLSNGIEKFIIFIIFFILIITIYVFSSKLLKSFIPKKSENSSHEIILTLLPLYGLLHVFISFKVVYLIAVFIVVPLFFVWKYALSGIKLYFLSFVCYWVILIPYAFITGDKFLNIYSTFGNTLAVIYYIAILFVTKYLHIRLYLSYKFLLYFILFISIISFITVIPEIDTSSLSETDTQYILIGLFVILYTFLFIWGIVAVNSVSDLLSSNISRFLFEKIQSQTKWKDIAISSVIDIFVGITLVSVTALLLSILLSSAYPILNDSSPIGLVAMERIQNTSSVSNAESISDSINIDFFMNGIISSLVIFPNSIFGFDIKKPDDETTGLIFVYWFFYFSVLVPSLLHFICLVALSFSKVATQLIQLPALYIHKLLIEKPLEDNSFGKAFSGTARATGIISILGMLFATLLYGIFQIVLNI